MCSGIQVVYNFSFPHSAARFLEFDALRLTAAAVKKYYVRKHFRVRERQAGVLCLSVYVMAGKSGKIRVIPLRHISVSLFRPTPTPRKSH